MKKYLSAIVVFILLTTLDQWTKYLAAAGLKDNEEFTIIKDVFVLQYLENRGAAFGVLQNQRILVLVLTILILVGVIFFWKKLPSNKRFSPLRWTGVLLCAGAVGNLIDRIWHGYVIDFLYFKLIDFPIFNVADCYVVVAAAVGILLISFYYKEDDFSFTSNHSKE